MSTGNSSKGREGVFSAMLSDEASFGPEMLLLDIGMLI
jgi:hypothetical protein